MVLRLIGWWWTDEEHRLFAKWMDQHAPGVAVSISLHIPYDKVGVADVRLPRGCERHAFVHIGYTDESAPRDVYEQHLDELKKLLELPGKAHRATVDAEVFGTVDE